jgi:hypothetical protein
LGGRRRVGWVSRPPRLAGRHPTTGLYKIVYGFQITIVSELQYFSKGASTRVESCERTQQSLIPPFTVQRQRVSHAQQSLHNPMRRFMHDPTRNVAQNLGNERYVVLCCAGDSAQNPTP